jgi:hypothetical protein
MILSSRSFRRWLPVAAACFLTVCGGGDSPSSVTPPPTTIAPAPAPTPTPTAAPTSCSRLAPVSGQGDCRRETTGFLLKVEEAIELLAREKPQVFDLGDQNGPGNYRVRSVGQYYVGVIENLEKAGLCADFDGEELAVTNVAGYSEQLHILTSDGYVRKGANSYRVTCYPAVLPTPMPALPPTPGCSLAPSKEKACSRESSVYLKDVEDSIELVAKEHPEFFNLEQRKNDNWYRIVNGDAYINAVVEALRKKNLCARFDGAEIQVKGENVKSEQFDVFAQDGYTRRGDGAYRASCYPAAF